MSIFISVSKGIREIGQGCWGAVGYNKHTGAERRAAIYNDSHESPQQRMIITAAATVEGDNMSRHPRLTTHTTAVHPQSQFSHSRNESLLM